MKGELLRFYEGTNYYHNLRRLTRVISVVVLCKKKENVIDKVSFDPFFVVLAKDDKPHVRFRWEMFFPLKCP